MKKRVNQSWGNHKKSTATRRLRGVSNALPPKSSGPQSQMVPAMKELLSKSQLHSPDELERCAKGDLPVSGSPEYPVRLMQHTSPAQLGQQINEIVLNSSAETLLPQIAQALGAAFWVDCCLIMVTVDSSTQIGYWNDNNSATPPQHQLLASKAQLISLIPDGCAALVIDDIKSDDERPLIEWHLPSPIRAVMAIPIWFQGKMNGIISLLRSQPYQWSELEKEHALAVASPVAIAISQVVQTSLISSLQQQVHASSQYQNLLKQLTFSSRNSLELNQLFKQVLAGTAQALQVERGLIVTLKYVDPLFKTRSRKNIPKVKATVVCEWHSEKSNVPESDAAVSMLNQSFWISESWLCQQAFINSPKPLVIDAEHKLEAIDPANDIALLFNLNRLPTVLILPLESQGTVLGFLVLQHGSGRLWQSEELALVELVSAQVSNAIIQSQTLKQVQGLVEERTAQLQRSLEVQAKLYEKTRQQIDQLRQLNQLKDEFVSTMSHELRTPLTSMSLAIRMLRQSTGLLPERQAKYLDILEQQCNQEINLVKDILKLQELESHQAPLNLETIDFNPKIHDLADSFAEKWADKGLNITVDLQNAPLLIQTDADSLERILQELLTNAGKYSDSDTNIVLKVTHRSNQQDKQIVLTLTNFGPGISPEDATHIFDKFRRGQGVTQKVIQGTGLGLALVKCLVQQLNGTIAVSSSPDTQSFAWETCFTLTLPQFFDHTKS